MKRGARIQRLITALEMARGWIDANREAENTGEGQEARWIIETIDLTIAEARKAP